MQHCMKEENLSDLNRTFLLSVKNKHFDGQQHEWRCSLLNCQDTTERKEEQQQVLEAGDMPLGCT